MVSDSTRDYFNAAQRKLFTQDGEHILEKALVGEHISPVVDGNGVDSTAQTTPRLGFSNDPRFEGPPHVGDNEYSQRRAANTGAAVSTQPRLVGANDVTQTAAGGSGGGFPSLSLDPPFLQ